MRLQPSRRDAPGAQEVGDPGAGGGCEAARPALDGPDATEGSTEVPALDHRRDRSDCDAPCDARREARATAASTAKTCGSCAPISLKLRASSKTYSGLAPLGPTAEAI